MLDAPIATIFATPGWFSRHPLAGAAQYEVGTVRLSSPHLEHLHPEWWGAGDPGDAARPGDDEALAAALRAALRDRVGEVAARSLPLRALAVELRGTYTLAQTLRLSEATVGAVSGIELRGVAHVDAAPTFRCSELFNRRAPMIDIRGMRGVALKDLRFDAGARALSCLTIEDEAGDVAERAHLLRHCSFRNAFGPLVSYRANGSALAPSPTLPLPVAGLRVEHCRFSPRPGTTKPAAALLVSGPEATLIDLNGCTFAGEAGAMIHAGTCALTVAGCHFRNTLLPLLPRGAPSSDALHGGGPVGGVDIYLDGPDDGAAAALYAQDCRSTSPQFLVTRADGRGTSGNVTVVGLRYARGPEIVLQRRTPQVREHRADPLPGVMEVTPIAPPALVESALVQAPAKIGQTLPLMAPEYLAPPVAEGSSVKQKQGPPLEAAPLLTSEVLPRLGKEVELPLKHTELEPLGGPTPGIPFSPVLWRLPASGGGRLVLIGCRFDFSGDDASPSVRGVGGVGEIVDLGVLRNPWRSAQISTAAPSAHVEVPPWPRRTA